jgi:hypothetical protein
MQRISLITILAGIVLSAPVLTKPVSAQPSMTSGTGGAGVTATTRPPVPAVPPPVSTPGMTAGQTPTNPPEVIGRPAAPDTRPLLSAPLTGSTGGALGGSDQVNPSMGGSTNSR